MTVLFSSGQQMTFPTATKASIGKQEPPLGTPIIFQDEAGEMVAVFRFELLVGYWQDVDVPPLPSVAVEPKPARKAK